MYIRFDDVTVEICDDEMLYDMVAEYFPFCIVQQATGKYVIEYSGSKSSMGDLSTSNAQRVTNFMGENYFLVKEGEKTILVSDNNSYGNHVVTIEGNHYNIYDRDGSNINGRRWVIRICRDLIALEYVRRGYVPLHASAIELNNSAIVFIGKKGKGKTTAMFSSVYNGANVMSNDVVFVGKRNGLWNVIGWPWRITVGNELLNVTPYKELRDPSALKTAFTPKKFCKVMKCEWVWSAPLKAIIFPEISLEKGVETIEIENNEIERMFLKSGFEVEDFQDIFTGEQWKFDFEHFAQNVFSDVKKLQISGDFWPYGNHMIEQLKSIL